MLNAAASRAAKEHGQQLAIDFAGEDWKARVLVELRAWCATRRAQGHEEITMEQFRAVARNVPTSHKAWGTLPAIACKAGILAPMAHADGSPVMRFAESVKTHRHPVRAWRLLPSSFASTQPAGAPSPSFTLPPCAVAGQGENAPANVGQVRHSHSSEVRA
jgi:hypothetical protein